MTPEILIIETPNLGDRSYVVGMDQTAVVVDPQRDIDRIYTALQDRDWTVTHVVETHVHNDYVSGGLVLAKELGAEYVVPSGHDYDFEAQQVHDGHTFTSAGMHWRVLHTPGHTPHHVSYAVAVEGQDVAVFTGGSLLFGSVGRPDLIGPQATPGLAHAQWHSVRRLVEQVADDAMVMPTHGFGSFCSATATSGLASTVGAQDTVLAVRFPANDLQFYYGYGQDMFPVRAMDGTGGTQFYIVSSGSVTGRGESFLFTGEMKGNLAEATLGHFDDTIISDLRYERTTSGTDRVVVLDEALERVWKVENGGNSLSQVATTGPSPRNLQLRSSCAFWTHQNGSARELHMARVP